MRDQIAELAYQVGYLRQTIKNSAETIDMWRRVDLSGADLRARLEPIVRDLHRTLVEMDKVETYGVPSRDLCR